MNRDENGQHNLRQILGSFAAVAAPRSVTIVLDPYRSNAVYIIVSYDQERTCVILLSHVHANSWSATTELVVDNGNDEVIGINPGERRFITVGRRDRFAFVNTLLPTGTIVWRVVEVEEFETKIPR
jgi:hypothetical protein